MFDFIIALSIAAILEVKLGEPDRFHPLITLGSAISSLERTFNKGSSSKRLLWGMLCTLLLVFSISFLVYSFKALLLSSPLAKFTPLFSGIILWLCVGYTSLKQHIEAIAAPLKQGDLLVARRMLSRIVSRDTLESNEQAVINGALESALENTSDSIIAPIFWFAIFGPAGCVAYRIINTLDAMWGYKTTKYIDFGRFSAELDDLVNFIPARLTSYAFYLQAPNKDTVIRSWKEQAPQWDSPNAGLVMATGASCLGVRLGGEAHYNGRVKNRPKAGYGALATTGSLDKCVKLITNTTLVCIALIVVVKLTLVWLT